MTSADALVAELEQRRWQALTSGDLNELERLFDERLTYTHSNGLVDTKESYLAALRNGVFRYLDVNVQEAVFLTLDRTIVVAGSAVTTSESSGGRLVSDLRYTGVWSQVEEDWKFVAWHSCPTSG